MIARGAPRWVLAPFALEVVGAAVYAGYPTPVTLAVFLVLAAILTFLGLALLLFFRDPERPIGKDVVSPADGRILAADTRDGSVSIFMNVHNVHVNRAPLGGIVESVKYRPGAHARADSSEASQNERFETRIGTALGDLHLTQISGAVARRIVPYIQEGDRVRKGQRIGLIRLGSRVDIRLPPGLRVIVAVGDKVLAGKTTIAEVAR